MEIEKSKLLKALETVKPGLASKEMIEQSTHFCFKDKFVITYNDEISISCPIDLELEGAVNATELYGYLQKVSGDKLELTETETEIVIKAGKSKAGFVLIPEIKLPIEEIGKVSKWKKLPDNFLAGVNFAMSVCSRDMSKPLLTCVHVNEEHVEASDNYRAARFILTEKMPVKSFLLPANICVKLVKLSIEEVAEGTGWIHFKTIDKAIISCRIFEETFPDISKHLQVKGPSITFPKTITGILDRAGVFAKRDQMLDESIIVNVSEKKIQIKAESASGWYDEKEKIDYSGEEITFSITPYLFKDILKQTDKGIIGKTMLCFKGENWTYITMVK